VDEPTEAPDPQIRPRWSRSDRAVPRLLLRPLQEFLSTSTSSATLLLAASVVAVTWANIGPSYEAVWSSTAEVRVADWSIRLDLRQWVNEGLMTLFFLVVGLEIKREVLIGELVRLRVALLPVIVALSGMVVPAVLYAALIRGGVGHEGWAIPMATDIVFALGVIALAGASVPGAIRSLLLALAIVDDIGSLLVVAFLSPGQTGLGWLVAALAVCGLVFLFPKVNVRAAPVYVLLGIATWYALFRAGVHPALAGVAMGLLTPAEPFQRPAAVSGEARRIADATSDDPSPVSTDVERWLRLADLSREAVSPLARVEHLLLPWTSFVVLPLFALANLGVDLSPASLAAAAGSAVAWAIVAARIAGKVIGIGGGALFASATGVAEIPETVDRRHVTGMAVAAGTGFTVPLFIAQLVFGGTSLLDQVRIALLVASIVSAVAGVLLLRRAAPRTTASNVPPPSI
jgi:NhaA family Na+:H+ antiporter